MVPAQEFTPLESERLLLRRFKPADLEPFHAYRSDPAVAKYQGWGEFTLEDARRFVDDQLGRNPGELGQGAQIAIELQASGAMIGDVYLNTPADEPRQAQIGYSLATRYQGAGYATEAVRRLLDYVFGPLDKHRVTAVTDTENVRSIALLERIGLRREAHFIQNYWFKGKWSDEYVYAILQSEWPPSPGLAPRNSSSRGG